MFRHLDDPAPPAPTAAGMRSVLDRADELRRGAARRRRARRRAGALVLAAVAAVALVAAGMAVTGRPAGAPSSETAYQFESRTVPLAIGTPVPAAALTDVVFVNGGNGFALADHRDRLLLASSVDGGASWDVADPRLPVPFTGADAAGAAVEFTSTGSGYLWSTSRQGSASEGLWVTADGGTTWVHAPVGPYVYDLSAIGSDAWALAGTCPAGGGPATPSQSGPAGAACAVTLDVSVDGGRHWSPTPAAPPVAAMTSGRPFEMELARVTAGRAYVLSGTPQAASDLAFTANGGATWSALPVPCAPPFDLGAELALSGTEDLWLLCGGQATAGSQAKVLFRSSDGGHSWALTAQTASFAGAPPPPVGVGSLPLAGYIAPYSIGHKNLAVLSAGQAWLAADRGPVVETTDGGAAWAEVTPLADAGFSTGAPGNLTFLGAHQGWIVEQGLGLWATSDGVHWAPPGTPPTPDRPGTPGTSGTPRAPGPPGT